jgi:dUTP pyrophosphatase
MLKRDFEKISKDQWFEKTGDILRYENIQIPQRATDGSAGYDFSTPYDFEIPPNSTQKIYTGLKCAVHHNEVLQLYIRSSLATKFDIELRNAVGIIDHDYFDNPDNEGHIIIALYNDGNKTFNAKTGDKVAQGIIINYLITDSDCPISQKRIGGFGSTTAI